MNSLTSKEKTNKTHIKKEKKKHIITKGNNNNYVIFSKGSYSYFNKNEDPYEHNYEKIYTKKKNNFKNNKSDEVELENNISKINDSFCDKKSERDSLILQISGTESIKEIKYKKNKKKDINILSSPTKNKTPEKKLKDIKKMVKTRKYRQRKENQNKVIERNLEENLNIYNNNNINTATFNEDNIIKKYNEFTFHKDDNSNNNENNNDMNNNINNNNDEDNYNNNYDEKRNGGKVDLFNSKDNNEDMNSYNINKNYNDNNYINKNNENHISIDADGRRKILKLLKLNKLNKLNIKKKQLLHISKSQDQLNLIMSPKPKMKDSYNNNNNEESYNGNTFATLGNVGKLDKKLLKEIIYDKGSPRVLEKKIFKSRNINKNSEIERSPKLINHSFDAPLTYKKKIIKRYSNIPKKKKTQYKMQRTKTEDKLMPSIYLNDNNNNHIYYSNNKSNENSILKQSIGVNYINNNSSLTPMNKKLIFTDGNKNIISNYYNNNFYNTPIKNYVEQSSIYIEYNKRSRSLNSSLKKIMDKTKKNKNYNQTNKKDNCINISLNNSLSNLNNSFYINNSTINNNNAIPKYEINTNFAYEYRSLKRPLNNLKNNKIKQISINFEELMIIGEKLFDIVKALLNKKKMANQCFEFWNYFFNSSLPKEIESLMLNSELKDAIYSINYTLMSILIFYDYSFDVPLLEKCFSLLKETLELIINNYIIFCKYIIKKVSKKNKNNKWIYKLNNMLSKNNIYSNSNNNINNNNIIMNKISSVEKIIYNTNTIIKNLNIILEHFKSNSNESLLILFKKISQRNYKEINYYYRTFLLREENINGSFLVSLYLKDNPNFHSVQKPYIKKPNYKKYTLILDLEETLINFRLKSENKGEGILKLRPGLYQFLDEVQKYYEIILFTASSQDYAESLIDTIEEKKKYFEYKFFRQHNIVIENDFVKDISRIGRDLDKIIIVDNMPQNYRLHKKNGINIKGFWGENLRDRVLYDLKEILIRVAKNGGDLRIGLEQYHEDIAERITSRIYKYNSE